MFSLKGFNFRNYFPFGENTFFIVSWISSSWFMAWSLRITGRDLSVLNYPTNMIGGEEVSVLLVFPLPCLRLTSPGWSAWLNFPTAQRFPFCRNSMDFHINIGTICSTILHRAIPHADAQNLLSTMFTYSGSVYTGYIQMPQPVFFLCTVCHHMIYTYNTNSLLSLISVHITKTTDYTPWWFVKWFFVFYWS